MVSNTLVALATAIAAAEAAVKGFNYGSTNTAGAALVQSDFEALMNRANDLQGTSGFNSARLYTMIQSGTTNTPIEAIPAAISTKTSLLLGMWASAGQADFDNEIAALKSAISQYPGLANMVIGLSVGSEDLYRDSVTGVENNDGVGAGPDVLTSYISQVKSALQGTALSGVSVGHVDTWDAWTNGSNAAVISAADWLGVDSYPYFETTVPNSISDAHTAFFNSYDATKAVADGKPVWITETGWPVSGPNSGSAVASTQNAETYWQDVGCQILGEINTWWYTLQDAMPTTPSPSFGIIGSDLSSAPLYDLTCKANSTSTSTTGSSTSTAASTGKSTATGGATGGAHSSGSGAAPTGSSAAQSSATSASGKPTLSMNGTVTASSYASASATGTGSAVWPSTTGGSSNGTATVAATSGVSATGTVPVPTSTPTQPVVNAATQAGSAMGAAILAVFALVAAF